MQEKRREENRRQEGWMEGKRRKIKGEKNKKEKIKEKKNKVNIFPSFFLCKLDQVFLLFTKIKTH